MKTIGMLAAIVLSVVAGQAAQADPVFTTDFTIDHCTGTCGPAGTVFGTITLTDTAAGVDFDVAVKNGAAFNFNGNGLSTFSFSVTPTLTAANFTGLPSGYASVIPNPNQDGFGDFKYGVDNSTHGTSTTDLTFTVLGINFADFILSQNGDPNVLFAIDITGPNTKTGLIGASGLSITPVDVNPVPIPGAVWLFASGMGGLWALSRRKRKEKAAQHEMLTA